MKNIKEKLSSLSFFLAILLFLIAFNFSDNPVGNWYQQFMPNIGGRNITDAFFLDSLTGWSVTNATNQNPDTTFVLKTTNGGDSWTILYRKIQTGGGFPGYFRVYFLNQSMGYTCGVTGFDKSTDGGISWASFSPLVDTYLDMSVLNQDTIWLVSENLLTGGVFRTTNGGTNWMLQQSFGSNNPNHIYMFNRNIGFISNSTGSNLWKTVNSGMSWTPISGADGFYDMFFVDSLTGWKANVSMKKTTDGGLNWVTQVLPSGGIIITSSMTSFSNVSRDTIWGNGGQAFYGSGQFRGVLCRTTNGGANWLFQIPDTAIHIAGYRSCDFVDRLKGWAYSSAPTGVHTTAGGDPIFYTEVRQISSEVPKEYLLFQNYPNPFNSGSKFKVLIRSNVKRQTSDVKVRVYDITGREVSILLDDKLAPGEYEITFDAKELPSGVYFYSLIVDGSVIDTKKAILLK
jgi:photosystem II stability/assembly factor-like uncharacterized protein